MLTNSDLCIFFFSTYRPTYFAISFAKLIHLQNKDCHQPHISIPHRSLLATTFSLSFPNFQEKIKQTYVRNTNPQLFLQREKKSQMMSFCLLVLKT